MITEVVFTFCGAFNTFNKIKQLKQENKDVKITVDIKIKEYQNVLFYLRDTDFLDGIKFIVY